MPFSLPYFRVYTTILNNRLEINGLSVIYSRVTKNAAPNELLILASTSLFYLLVSPCLLRKTFVFPVIMAALCLHKLVDVSFKNRGACFSGFLNNILITKTEDCFR